MTFSLKLCKFVLSLQPTQSDIGQVVFADPYHNITMIDVCTQSLYSTPSKVRNNEVKDRFIQNLPFLWCQIKNSATLATKLHNRNVTTSYLSDAFSLFLCKIQLNNGHTGFVAMQTPPCARVMEFSKCGGRYWDHRRNHKTGLKYA